MQQIPTPSENAYLSEHAVRQTKLQTIRQQGVGFPNHFRKNSDAAQLKQQYGAESLASSHALNHSVKVAGRIITRRLMGKADFVTLQGGTGTIQLYVTCDHLTEGFFESQFKQWNLGDMIGAIGTLFKTKTGELTIACQKLLLLTKALRPLPDKFHGLTDSERCYR